MGTTTAGWADEEVVEAPVINRQTITVGKTTWAIEIAWSRRLEGVTPTRARMEAIREGRDIYAVNGHEQFGSSSTSQGHKPGMPSLALAMVEEAEGSNLIGGFRCSDGRFYIIAVISGQVWPGYDNIYDESEAVEMVGELSLRNQFEFVYAPPEWALHEAKTTPLAELLQAARPRRHRLVGVSNKKQYAKIGAAAVIIALAYVGWTFYQEYQTEQLIEEGQREQELARQQAERQAKLNQPIYPPMPSIAAGRGMDTLRACVRFMDQVPQYQPGWIETKLECDGATVMLTMRQNNIGTINWLFPYIGQYKKPELNSPLEKLATAAWRLDPSSIPAWGDVKGQPPAAVARYLTSQMQEVYQDFTLGPALQPVIHTTTVGQRPIDVKAPWTTMDIEITQDAFFRDDVMDVIDRLQNFVLTKVEESLPDRKWTVTGTLYHALPKEDGTDNSNSGPHS